MGDVAMLLPVAYAVARANPDHEFTLLTQSSLIGLMILPPSNLEAMVLDIRYEERSFVGLLRYGGRLRKERFDAVIDLHDVLRTKLLRSLTWIGGARVSHLNKPRAQRGRLIAPPGKKILQPLPSMIDLYRQTLHHAGLNVPEVIPHVEVPHTVLPDLLSGCGDRPLVGIAPFASTESKTYDLGLMRHAVEQLSASGRCVVCLLGGRGREANTLQQWADEIPHVYSVAGKLELYEELALISRLCCVVSMDSANMHLASVVGTPVISIWCATHPYAGFLGLGQRLEDCILSGLDCSPCTVFGKLSRCLRDDMPCRRTAQPELIVQYVARYLPLTPMQQSI